MLWRASFRYLLHHPWQFGLSILGVALGVAVVVAIDLANASAQRAFTLSVETLTGRTTHQIVAGRTGLPESLYQTLRLQLAMRASQPVVEAYAQASIGSGQTLQIVGIDVLANSDFHPYLSATQGDIDMTRLITQPSTGLIAHDTAQRLGLKIGDAVPLSINGKQQRLVIIGLLKSSDALTDQGLQNVIITDIASAQELLGMLGRLSRIDLILPEQGGEKIIARIRAVLPPQAQLVSAATRANALQQMTRAFQLNLRALSLLALLIGAFLIYNTLSFSIVQRRALLGRLRAMGVTKGELFSLVIREALIVAILGASVGIVLGIALGQGLLQLVTRTINDLYFVVQVSSLTISVGALSKGLALGIGASVLAALWPAFEAVRVTPRRLLSRASMEARFLRRVPYAATAGGVLLLLSAAVLVIPSRSMLVSYAALFGIMAGFALLVPAAVLLMMRAVQGLAQRLFGWSGKLSARSISGSLSRSGIAVAALAIAVSATIGVSIMIDSFRHSVVHWLAHSLRADIFISRVDDHAQASLSPALIRSIAALPEIAMLSQSRHSYLETPAGRTELLAMQIPYAGFKGFQFKQGDSELAWTAFQQHDAVIVSEPYAYHHRLQVGDSIELPGDRGRQLFPIAGIFRDYSSSQGMVIMSRHSYEKFWQDRGIDSLGVYLKAGHKTEDVIERLRNIVGGESLQIRSNRALREASLAIFDRTFAITHVLRVLTVLIALVGIFSALMALQLERAKEFAVLRAIGATPRQLWGLISIETGLMGGAAGLLALPLGIALAFILIVVINRRSFGWTMELTLDPLLLIQALVLALLAALVAGLYPSLKIARSAPALALREE